MKRFLTATAILILAATGLSAETWTATCNKVMFVFDRSAKKFEIHLQDSSNGYALVSVGKIEFDNGIALHGTATPYDITQSARVGVNKDRNIVFFIQKAGNEMKEFNFCSTKVQIR